MRTVRVKRVHDAKAMGKKTIDSPGQEAWLILGCTEVEPSILATIYAHASSPPNVPPRRMEVSALGAPVFVGVGKDFQSIPFMRPFQRA